MTLIYDEAIDQEKIKELSESEIEEMCKILYDTTRNRDRGKILPTKPLTYEDELTSIKNLLDKSMFLLRVWDDNKLVAFRHMWSSKDIEIFKKPLPVNPAKSVKRAKLFKQLQTWWESEGLNMNESAMGNAALHLDYHGQGIMTNIRNQAIKECKNRGVTWIMGFGPREKIMYEYEMKYYAKHGFEVVLSDIDSPTGYGKGYYYKI